jgi:peptidyl-prolyl cis-trans isomerase SurA
MLLLTGCGSVPGFNPGVAVRVQDDSVSTDQVRATATAYCSASMKTQPGQAVPNHYVAGLAASSYALRTAADQLMADHDVTIDDSYDQAIDGAQKQLASLTDTQREAVVQVGAASLYVAAAETAVGRDVLGGSPSDDDAQAAGAKEFASWLDDHDVRIDPRYGVSIDKGTVVAADTSLSFALGDTAKKADAAQPDATYAGALPASQRCG